MPAAIVLHSAAIRLCAPGAVLFANLGRLIVDVLRGAQGSVTAREIAVEGHAAGAAIVAGLERH